MRIMMKKAATMKVPIFVFDKRRREVSIEFLRGEGQLKAALRASLAGIKAGPLLPVAKRG
jgi:hypothetical protein